MIMRAQQTMIMRAQQTMISDSNEIDLIDSLGEEMLSDNIATKNLTELLTEDRWDMACQISCLSCHSENVAKITHNKMTCSECEDQHNNML